MPDLSVELLGQRLKNPVMEASGTFGEEYSEFVDFTLLGALNPKTVSLEPFHGSPPPRADVVTCSRVLVKAAGLFDKIK